MINRKDSSSVCQNRHFVLNLLFLDNKNIHIKCEREIANKNNSPAILTAFLRGSIRNEERCSIPDAFISTTCAPGNQFSSRLGSDWTARCADKKNVEVVKNGAGSLQQFEMEKDYYIQKQKDEIALLRSQVSAIKLRHRYCLRQFF